MRTESEVVFAHDLTSGVLKLMWAVGGDDDKTVLGLTAAMDVLCWVLRHDHNQTFSENLNAMRGLFHKQDIELVEVIEDYCI